MEDINMFKGCKKIVFPRDTVEVKIFQNKNNKQFNLPVMKKHTSPEILKDVLANKDIVGFKFKITDLIFRNNKKGGKL